ncbi:hypothetical protein GA0111570_104267 [Raineyella antarctica]|uniref:Uncharacterized protein n=1 Tax=Raineyella antarctica TaxID=1577474 RepID=A0A1G6GQP9_9ACTN|nr:hypothetical protein [Raineyella antarctica]SDB84229.1 hypothetical protein GA0111570_104267 [Raineyella antarctica]
MGIIVVALVLGVVGWRLVQAQRFDQRLASDGEAARQVVQTYYTALRDGDAKAALATAAIRPEETSLLTDEVLRSAQEAGGIQNLSVGEAALANDNGARIVGDAGTVAVTYAVGSTPVRIDLPVTRDGGTWRISAATSRVDLGGKGVSRTVNGHQAGADVVELFPGTYTVGAASKLVTLGHPQLLVTAPDPLGAAAQTWGGGDATLSTDSRDAVLGAARASLTSCLAQRSLAPEGCPISIETGSEIQIDESTIRYQLVNDPWSKTEVQLASDGRATGTIDVEYRIEASAKSKGVEGVVRQTYTQSAVTFNADLSGDKPVISWQ